ncbi:SDR family NAD(P)-dependent oxidoreductase, partial [Sedimenticola sp.]|uniref:SDR family NAD(P)-dependent oxidoreductase n=1 Tax=Sedimenticola sp. TaxID=1940285 RepID=UPI003D13A30C
AQGELIREAIEKAGVDARAISYIEAHGTGTELGDPIEVTGLTQAFKVDTNEIQFCALGSTKSNIGHLESAAGIAGLTKVILQMQHKQLVPSLHAEKLNPNINFEKTPFMVQQGLSEWKRPEVEQNGDRREYPRIAGVSSFGAGGANAHVIIEEYLPGTSTQTTRQVTGQQSALVVLSAKTDKQLKVYAQQLLDYVEQQTEIHLADLAYTLQMGREEMDERVGLLVDSVESLKERLQQYVKGEKGIEDLHCGRVKQNKDALGMFIADTEFQEAVAKWIERGKYTKLLELWVKGFEVDWAKLYDGEQPRRISLPVYPFAKERYWLDIGREKPSLDEGEAIGRLHPLLHQNTSTLTEQRFSSLFSRSDEWVGQQIKGESVLPGMAYLEMACAAVIKASGFEDAPGLQLNDMVWAQPAVITEQRCPLHISLYPVTADRIGYEIYSDLDSTDAPLVHGQGHAVMGERVLAPVLMLAELKEQCQTTRLSGADVYRSLHSLGMDVGVAYRCLHEVLMGDRQLLASLRLPGSAEGVGRQFSLHPGLLDAALQAAIIGWVHQSGVTQPVLPYSLASLHLYQTCVTEMWASIHYAEGQASVSGPTVALDIDLCDNSGQLCVQLKGLVLRMLKGSIGTSIQSQQGILMVQPQWRVQAAELSRDIQSQRWAEHLIVLCEPGDGIERKLSQQLASRFKDVRCISLQCEHADLATRYNTYVLQIVEQLRGILSGKPKAPVLFQVVVPNSGGREEEEERAVLSGLSGLLRTAHQENPKLIGQLIETALDLSQVETLAERLVENRSLSVAPHIRYRDQKREVLEWYEAGCVAGNSEGIHPLPWKEKGVYLLTGGTGGLGLLFAKDIAKKVNDATLILTGRSALSEAKAEHLNELETRCSRVEYRQVDVTDPSAVEELLRDIEKVYGGLNGIVHSAGVILDNFILNKAAEEVGAVLAPKVSGLVNLDQASREMKLDFLVVFSSMSGALGNAGQADYAAANAFMDAYVHYRNRLVATGKRQGHTVSINWPLWKTGGMRMDAQTEQSMVERTGMIALQSDSGIRALYQALAIRGDQWMVMEGNLELMRERVLGYGRSSQPASQETLVPEPGEDIDRERVYEKTLYSLRRLFGNVAKLEVTRVESDEPLEQYGIDSIMITQLNRKLNEVFGELSKTLFYEYQTLAELTEYFLDEHWPACLSWTGLDAHYAEQAAPMADMAINDRAVPAPPKAVGEFPVLTSFKTKEVTETGGKVVSLGRFALTETGGAIREPIAIIGMSGRYPQANNLEEFWQNLEEGKDCISEIPE